MAENSNTNNSAPIPYKEVLRSSAKNIIQSRPQIYDTLINTLPFKLCGSGKFRLYQGFWIPEILLPGILFMQNHFQSRPTDLFLASYPKSGTTWLKALVFAIMTRNVYPLAKHPLLTNNPHECVAYMDLEFSDGGSSLIEAIPSPRILSTHLPYSMLPDSVTSTNCKIIYSCRDPKDVSVSLHCFINDQSVKGADMYASFKETFDVFCEGISTFGPIWDHISGYWQESRERPEKILFFRYEDVLQEPIKHVKRLAEFIRRPFSEAEEKQGMIEHIVELCSFQKLRNLEVNKTGELIGDWRNLRGQFSNASFFRKGLAGDWRNYMTHEMAQSLDGILKEKFKGSGLHVESDDEFEADLST